MIREATVFLKSQIASLWPKAITIYCVQRVYFLKFTNRFVAVIDAIVVMTIEHNFNKDRDDDTTLNSPIGLLQSLMP